MATAENFRKFCERLEQYWRFLNTEYQRAQGILVRALQVVASMQSMLDDSDGLPVYRTEEVKKLATEYWVCHKHMDRALEAYTSAWEGIKGEFEKILEGLGEEKPV